MKIEIGKFYQRRGGGIYLCTERHQRNDIRPSRYNLKDRLGAFVLSSEDGRWTGGDGFDHDNDMIHEALLSVAMEAFEKDVQPQKFSTEYGILAGVLREAYDHAATGKGHARHGSDGQTFTDQPSMEIARLVGTGYPLGQAMKKSAEAWRMDNIGKPDAAIAELLGVINYAAIAILAIRETKGT